VPTTTEVQSAYDRAAESQDNLLIDDATADVLRREMDEYEEAVHLARTVADFVHGRHELVLGPALYDTRLPEAQAARTAARLLAADAVVLAHDGDLDDALATCRAAIGVGRSIGDEPFPISQLVREVIGGEGLKSARRVLGQGEPSDAALAQLQALMLDEMNAPLLLYGMRGERAMLTELIRRVGSGELPISALLDQDAQSAAGDAQGAVAPWGRLWFDNQRAAALELMNHAVAIARRPPAEQLPEWKAWAEERFKLSSRLSPEVTFATVVVGANPVFRVFRSVSLYGLHRVPPKLTHERAFAHSLSKKTTLLLPSRTHQTQPLCSALPVQAHGR
jgi:hypothetical protein